MGAARTTVCGPKRGNWGSADDSGRAKGAGSRPVVVAAFRQVRLIAKKVADVNGRTCGLTEAAHAAGASWFRGFLSEPKFSKIQVFSSFTDFEEFCFSKKCFFYPSSRPARCTTNATVLHIISKRQGRTKKCRARLVRLDVLYNVV